MLEQPLTNPAVVGFATALGIGLLIGTERERRKGKGSARAPAGIRTFAVFSLLGAVAAQIGDATLVAVLLVAVTGFVWNAYRKQRSADPGITSEATLILTAMLGALAMQAPGLAAGVSVVVAALLAARGWLHYLVRHALSEEELHDLLILAAAILVILPLVPDHALGPFNAINPRQLWQIVVVVMSIGAAGYIARRIVGANFGLPLAGLLSGFVSSTATIGAMGALAGREPQLLRSAIAAAVLSTIATVAQLTAILAVLSPATLLQMRVSLFFAGAVALAYGGAFTWWAVRSANIDDSAPAGRAVNSLTAIAFAALVAFVQVVAAAFDAWFGSAGVAAAAAAAGFADTHAPAASAASLVESNRISVAQAGTAILLALSTNSIAKAVVAVTTGGRKYGLPVICGLALVIVAAWLGALLS